MVAVASILDFRFKVKKIKIDFQDGSRGGNLGYSIVMILAIFDLQVTTFCVSWTFSSGEKVQNTQM